MGEGAVDARRAALSGLLDDASTFPPARRDLAVALAAHTAAARGQHGWTAGRMVVSSASAERLAELLAELLDDGPGPTAVVVMPRSGVSTLGPVVRADAARLAPLVADGRVVLDGVEVPIGDGDLRDDLAEVVTALAVAGVEGVELACEVPLTGRPAGEVVRRISALRDIRDDGLPLRLKLSASGTMPTGVPSEVEVAGFLRASADAELPLTVSMGAVEAGRSGSGAVLLGHGLLNLIGAAALAYRGQPLDEIAGALAQPPSQIRLGPGALVVGGAVIDSDVLEDVRRDFLRTVSCVDHAAVAGSLVAVGALEADGTWS